jgi:hypothetical protein
MRCLSRAASRQPEQRVNLTTYQLVNRVNLKFPNVQLPKFRGLPPREPEGTRKPLKV